MSGWNPWNTFNFLEDLGNQSIFGTISTLFFFKIWFKQFEDWFIKFEEYLHRLIGNLLGLWILKKSKFKKWQGTFKYTFQGID